MNGYLRIDHQSEVPKYKQVVELIVSDIESGIFKQGQRIPSINETSEELLLSRDTVEKAYVFLRKKGILSSVRGKGYYVEECNVGRQIKVALIFNKLSNYKRSIYYSFIETLGNKAIVDVFIYNYDLQQFKSIIDNHVSKYDYYVILPHFKNENSDVAAVIQTIPREKVLLVDRNLETLKDYPIVYQEYEKDIQSALEEGIKLVRKYRKINLIFPSDQYYSKYIIRGFRIFCQVNEMKFAVIDQLSSHDVRKGEAYVIVSDDDLYRFIKICRLEKWKLGTDVGVVAYNDNPVKEILEDGITTISTNHDEIGRVAAEMILTKNFRRIKSPFRFIRRNSL
ncbi:GntR family transcriptional regulator [Mariniphaga sediminis]|jgi:DNA-binding transcriptional regulator YhcF (GntR family)|uniref:GntR family transcriptional regulator n=2 Tax=Mariniphaga sediminis TaxID=1628158 RepID=A0A399D1Z6_9BACT|nr:GntR family transcriptional regulator [Mariniphaga sediminis]RIH65483.1 GntR family transcriptional regulator [Mariniphaga sediminis]